MLVPHDIDDPALAPDEEIADDALDELERTADGEERQDRKRGKAAQNERDGNADRPDEAAVEQHRDLRLPAGAQRKIARVGKGVERHHAGGHPEEACRKVLHLVAGFIKPGNKRRGSGERGAEDQTGADRKRDDLPVRILRLLQLVRAEQVADDDADRGADGHEDDIEQIGYRARNVQRRDGGNAARRIALHHGRHAERPERLVQQQRRAFQHDLFCKAFGNVERAVNAFEEREARGMRVRVDDDDQKLDEARDDRSDRRAEHAERGETELSEDQKPVEQQIDEHGGPAADHRNEGFARFAQGEGVAHRNRVGNEPEQHDEDILAAVFERGKKVALRAAFVQEQIEQRPVEKAENDERGGGNGGADEKLEAEHVPHSVRVPFSRELRAENARAGKSAEDRQIEHEDQLIRDRDAAHLLGAEPPDHQIVQHVYELADAVLDHDGNDDRKDRPVKRFRADQF